VIHLKFNDDFHYHVRESTLWSVGIWSVSVEMCVALLLIYILILHHQGLNLTQTLVLHIPEKEKNKKKKYVSWPLFLRVHPSSL